MIEANGKRAYVDIYMPVSQYYDLKADAIFITHPHGDHYHPYSIDYVSKESTLYVGPSNCTEFISLYNGTGVVPGDTGEVAGFQYEAIPAYNPGHPPENNWCGYLITVNGISIFHSGDTYNLTEYEDLTGRVDVAVLPIEYSCGNMGPIGAVWATNVIQPRFVIPIHYGVSDTSEFITNCQAMNPRTRIHHSYGPLVLNSLF
jgi:L-ascorbate metabolism protein UlaG (beta-lactamase superfamily)